jgi:hypothetical protein
MSPPDRRSLVEAGRARKPTEADRERVKSALLARIAAGTAASSVTSAAAVGGSAKASGLALTLTTKILGSALLLATLGVGGWGVREATRSSAPPPTISASPVVSTSPVVSASPAVSALPVASSAPEAPAAVAPERPAAAPEGSAVAAPEGSAAVSLATAAEAKEKGRGHATNPAASAERSESASGQARIHEGSTPREVAGAPAASVAAAENAPDLLGAEVKQLREARQALQQGRASQALDLLGSSRGGALAAERAALRVAALCRAGRAAEARAEAGHVAPGAIAALLAPSLREQCGLLAAPPAP